MKIYGLCVLKGDDVLWREPILYSTDIRKLRNVMLNITGQDTVYIGTTDIDNAPDMNCHTKVGKAPYAKIIEMPTLV